MSPRRKYVVPWVLGVPDFTDTEIHIGNSPSDTEGCCLVGKTLSTDWVGNSADAFSALMSELQNTAEDISITYIEGPQAV